MPIAYSDEEKYKAVVAYYIGGSYAEASRTTGIPTGTLEGWGKSAWWDGMLEKVIQDTSFKLRSAGNKIVDLATAAVIDRLQNGDEVIDKYGNFLRRKVSLKDALLASLTWFDKTRIINDKTMKFVNNKTTVKELMSEMVAIADKNRREAADGLPEIENIVPSEDKQCI